MLATCILFVTSCSYSTADKKAEENWSAKITEFDDNGYPDNPDKSIRSKVDGSFSHSDVVITRAANGYDMAFLPANEKSDTLLLTSLDLNVWMPFCPTQVRSDDFFKKVVFQNSEFNRQQITLAPDQFKLSGNGSEHTTLNRVDPARNCLNGGLWEVIAYTEEGGSMKPAYHGWFDFPEKLYSELFEERNELDFATYRHWLYDWEDLPAEKLNLELLRTVEASEAAQFESRNSEMYEMIGERKKKAVNIVYPTHFASIQDFLTDSSVFSTFSPPGLYERKAPKHTQLGRLANLKDIQWRKTKSLCEGNPETFELEMNFERMDQSELTKVIIGGLQREKLPVLGVEKAHKGFQMPMGVSNHSFYESYDFASKHPQESNPFFALITDAEGKFVDSHNLGIDGPLMHLDAEDNSKLHVWLLSFERHSLVGHYIVQLPQSV